MSNNPPPPWDKFLQELDNLLDEPFEFHCIGGFALVAAYGLPRSTNDLDYYCLIPFNRIRDLQEIAGQGSPLARKHKVYMQHAGVASVPENYKDRMTELFAGQFKQIRLFVLDPYDLILSKLSRGEHRDRDDAKYLAETLRLDPSVLQKRYTTELRANLIGPPERHDNTLEFWLEAYFDRRPNK